MYCPNCASELVEMATNGDILHTAKKSKMVCENNHAFVVMQRIVIVIPDETTIITFIHSVYVPDKQALEAWLAKEYESELSYPLPNRRS